MVDASMREKPNGFQLQHSRSTPAIELTLSEMTAELECSHLIQ